MKSRRQFIKETGLHSAALSLLPILPIDLAALERIGIPEMSPDSSDEDFWTGIQMSFDNSKSLINLNNGGVSPHPKYVREAFELYNSVSNEAPAYQMWRILEPGRVNIRRDLAALLGCELEEVVINRNTTEALGTVIFGMDFAKGDEVVLTHFDYPNMRNAWEQRKRRDGIVLKYINLALPQDSNEQIVEKYANAITPKTKLVLITHMVNYNGQLLPAAAIVEAVRKKNSETRIMVDGAHTFAHIPFSLRDIPCDFFGTSLHKWLCAPFGSGLMYIRKDRIKEIWPIFPTDATGDDDIRKFEAMGTRSVPTEIAVGQAIVFHQNLGVERKYRRLKQLTDYWTAPFLKNPRFISYNPMREGEYASLFTFGIEGLTADEISNHLQKNYQIITSPIVWQNINGTRVSPHVYTTFADLDKLMEGVNQLLKK